MANAEESYAGGTCRPGIAILGGSFNPLHAGHLRLAIEVHELLGRRIDRVDLLPCAHPPHKDGSQLLPFDVRCAMIRAVAAQYPWLQCNPLEGEREKLSYTWDTLGQYRLREPGRELYFILGSQDYVLLPTWFHGLELPSRCTLVVLPRGSFDAEAFAVATRQLWPDAVEGPDVAGGSSMVLPDGRRVICLSVTWLDISSTMIRERFLAGRCIDFLVPDSVKTFLAAHADCPARFWQKR